MSTQIGTVVKNRCAPGADAGNRGEPIRWNRFARTAAGQRACGTPGREMRVCPNRGYPHF